MMEALIGLALSVVVGGVITWALSVATYIALGHGILEGAVKSFWLAAALFIVDLVITVTWIILMVMYILRLAGVPV